MTRRLVPTPRTVDGMIRWLRAHPDEPFYTLYSKDRLLIGTRTDTGELNVWDCAVIDYEWGFVASPREKKHPAPRVRGGEGDAE